MENFASRLNMIQRGQNFFQPELLILSQDGWGSDQDPSFLCKTDFALELSKHLRQNSGSVCKKIWARSPLKQQTLKNDTLLNSCSRDPTFCIMNVHLFGVKVLLALFLISLEQWMFITSLPLPLFHHLVYNSPWHGMAHIIDLFVFIFKATHLLYIISLLLKSKARTRTS